MYQKLLTSAAFLYASALFAQPQLTLLSLESTPESPQEIAVLPPSSDSARYALLNESKKFIGTPYRYGGTTPKGFDCSGFIQHIYRLQGYLLPRTSRDQFSQLTPVSAPKPGDLVFFHRGGRINHVGLYIGGGKMIHSPQSGERVRIESIEKPNWKRRYAGARTILHRSRRAPDDLPNLPKPAHDFPRSVVLVLNLQAKSSIKRL